MLSIDEIKQKIIPICEKHGVLKAVLFGSYARNEATPESDVDFQLTLPKGTGLLKLCTINNEFEDALEKDVDVITHIPQRTDLLFYNHFRETFSRDRIVLYEAE